MSTNVADTVNTVHMDICQKIKLFLNCTYTLKFDLLTDSILSSGGIIVNINGTQKYTKNYSTSPTIFNESYTFLTNSTGLT